jgi:hypothetical protein
MRFGCGRKSRAARSLPINYNASRRARERERETGEPKNRAPPVCNADLRRYKTAA